MINLLKWIITALTTLLLTTTLQIVVTVQFYPRNVSIFLFPISVVGALLMNKLHNFIWRKSKK